MMKKTLFFAAIVALLSACGDDSPQKPANNTSTNNTSTNNTSTNNTSTNNTSTNNNELDMDIDMPDPDMDIDMPDPDMDIDMPDPDMDIDMPDPDMDIDMPDPDMDIDMPDPDMDIDMPDPDMDMSNPVLPNAAAAAEIAAIRGGTPGTITGAAVTYLKAALGNDDAGFFIQATQDGPAMFVRVDPATTTPALQVGDIVNLDVTATVALDGITAADTIQNLSVTGSGYDVTNLLQDVSSATDLVTGLDSYEAELVTVAFEVVGTFGFAGTSHTGADIETLGVTGSTDLEIRLPSTLQDAYGFETGCLMELETGVVWRFAARTQLSAYNFSDFGTIVCPDPKLTGAIASSETEVTLTFSRGIDPASVLADGSQFTLDGGLTVSAATVNGNQITLTTSSQTAGEAYIVTVANTVLDVLGGGVDAANDEEIFEGYSVPAVLRINEVAANFGPNGACDLVEFRVVSGGVLNGMTFWERTSSIFTFPSISVATNDIIVLHIASGNASCNPGSATDELTAINQFPAATYAANYDTAWDFYSSDPGLTSTDNVFTVVTALGDIQDAVFGATGDGTAATAAAATETRAAQVAAAGQWENVGGGLPVGGYIDTDFNLNAVPGLNSTTESQQRINDADANTKADWTAVPAAPTFGALNAGQAPF